MNLEVGMLFFFQIAPRFPKGWTRSMIARCCIIAGYELTKAEMMPYSSSHLTSSTPHSTTTPTPHQIVPSDHTL